MNEIELDDLIQFDVDNYVNWVFNHQPVSRQFKKETVKMMVGNNASISELRSAIDEVFFKTTYWKSPSEEDKINFPYWRKRQYEYDLDFYRSTYVGSPLPLHLIQKREVERIATSIDNLYAKEMDDLILARLNENYYGIACVAGKIDYLKKLFSADKKSKSANSKQTAENTAWLPANNEARQLLFNQLVDEGLISKDCGLEDFFATGRKISWSGKNTTLIYVIEQLKNRKYLKESLTLNEILELHFLDARSRPFDRDSINSTKSRSSTTTIYKASEINSIFARLPKPVPVKGVKG